MRRLDIVTVPYFLAKLNTRPGLKKKGYAKLTALNKYRNKILHQVSFFIFS